MNQINAIGNYCWVTSEKFSQRPDGPNFVGCFGHEVFVIKNSNGTITSISVFGMGEVRTRLIT